MKRAEVLKAMQSAGIANDQAALLRLHTSHRISWERSKAAFDEGRRIARNFADREDVQRKSGILDMSGDAA